VIVGHVHGRPRRDLGVCRDFRSKAVNNQGSYVGNLARRRNELLDRGPARSYLREKESFSAEFR